MQNQLQKHLMLLQGILFAQQDHLHAGHLNARVSGAVILLTGKVVLRNTMFKL